MLALIISVWQRWLDASTIRHAMQFPRLATDTQPHRRRHTTVVLGRLSPREQHELKQRAPASANWLWAAELEQVLAPIAAGRVDRVLLMQARPGELKPELPELLLKASPDLELLSVAGAWCEGELRTGAPWEGIHRVYWGQIADESTDPPPASQRPLVIVNAQTFDNASAWIDTLDELGYSGVWAQRETAEPLVAGEALGIWDGAQLSGREARALQSFCMKRRESAAPVLAVLDFPRADAIAAARAIGSDAVLGRPWSLEDVNATIARVLGNAPPAQLTASIPPSKAA